MHELSELIPRFTDGILKGKAMPTPSTVHAIGDRIYFWRYNTNAIGCVDVTTGKVTLIEVPIQELDGKAVWSEKEFTFTKGILNAEGTVANNRVGSVRGVVRGGFGHTNPAWPIFLEDRLYWQGGAGLLYIIDTKKAFTPQAISWRSIDTQGNSWTFGEPALDKQHIFVRSQREWVKFPR